MSQSIEEGQGLLKKALTGRNRAGSRKAVEGFGTDVNDATQRVTNHAALGVANSDFCFVTDLLQFVQ